jgi:hypothetical protein
MSLFVFNSLNLPSTRIPRQWPPEATHEHSIFGQKVLWCPVSRGGSHFAAEELEPYRHVGDFHLDDLLERLDREGVPLTAGGDLLELIDKVEQGYYDSQLSDKLRTDLISFLAKYKTVPQWVNVQQLERGRQVFLMYAPAMGASLYYRSLVPGFSIPQLAAVDIWHLLLRKSKSRIDLWTLVPWCLLAWWVVSNHCLMEVMDGKLLCMFVSCMPRYDDD